MHSFFNTKKTLSILAFSASMAFAATPTVEIGTWGDFCKGALSFTFDDYPTSGATQIGTKGREAFDAKKFHMTIFAITSGQTADSWKALDTCFAHGHEVGSHNYRHDASADSLLASQITTKKKVPGEKCISLAYPNGTNIAAAANYFVAARDAGGNVNGKTPSFMHIGCTGFGSGQGGYKNDAASMNSLADKAASDNGWAVEMHHGIGSDSHSWSTTNLDEMKKHLEYLDTKRSTIWVETFGNVARYIKERDAAKATVTSSDDNTIKLTLTDNLADSIYNYPLSLRCETPTGWTNPSVTQNSKTVKDTIVTASSKSYIMFQAVPDGGEIIISKNDVSVAQNRTILSASGKMMVLSNSKLSINSSEFTGDNIAVTLFDLKGKVIAQYKLKSSESSIDLPVDKINTSAFVIKVSDGRKTIIDRFTPQM